MYRISLEAYRIPLEAMPSQSSYPALLDCLSMQAAGGWRVRVCLSLSLGVGVLAAQWGASCLPDPEFKFRCSECFPGGEWQSQRFG